MKCGYESCNESNPKYTCSRCHNIKYCCQDHQIIHWKSSHKFICKNISKITTNIINNNKSSNLEDKGINKTANEVEIEKRSCRCMFCGEQLILSSEDEAINHMKICSSLQEQLESKEQFTIPNNIKDKMKKNES